MTHVLPPPPVVSLAVTGTDARFPVRRIYCVGRNYEKHVIEMNEGADLRDPPFFFQKPRDAVVEDGATIPFPVATDNLHHEVELVAAIGTGGAHIAVADALAHVSHYGVGIDLTRRDRQTEAKDHSWPWEMGKAFDHSAPIGPLTPAAEAGHDPRDLSIRVDGTVRQHSSTAAMTWSVAEIVSKLSEHYRLEPGDIILTGTPEGVGRIGPGAVLEARADGLAPLRVTMGGGA